VPIISSTYPTVNVPLKPREPLLLEPSRFHSIASPLRLASLLLVSQKTFGKPLLILDSPASTSRNSDGGLETPRFRECSRANSQGSCSRRGKRAKALRNRRSESRGSPSGRPILMIARSGPGCPAFGGCLSGLLPAMVLVAHLRVRGGCVPRGESGVYSWFVARSCMAVAEALGWSPQGSRPMRLCLESAADSADGGGSGGAWLHASLGISSFLDHCGSSIMGPIRAMGIRHAAAVRQRSRTTEP